jgi:hypothetical protein
MKHTREVPRMTAGCAALVELTRRYLGGLLDPFVTLLEVHKLMYFMQEAGEQRLRGFEVNTLTVVATESYEQFAENLQREIEEDSFRVRPRVSVADWILTLRRSALTPTLIPSPIEGEGRLQRRAP